MQTQQVDTRADCSDDYPLTGQVGMDGDDSRCQTCRWSVAPKCKI